MEKCNLYCMRVYEFIPVLKKPERPKEGVIYLENDDSHQTLASKIDMLKDYDFDYAVFHHQDLIIRTPELIEPNCQRMRVDNVAVAGVIGTMYMSTAAAWWMHQRGVVTAGAILQGDGKGGEYPMLDGPGYRTDMVSVDGCLMVFDKKFIDAYVPHDFGHFRFGYDADCCFQALQMGRKVGIVDVQCKHDSQGSFDQKEFAAYQKKFVEYWKQFVDFPVIVQSRWTHE